ncbi:alanine racemase [candidate division WOR-3 bacterium]|nr:alanine racemase [candidate division WOR-3 bacterium]
MRPSRVEINLKNLEENIKKAKEKLSNKKLLAVVKADAYGHGAVAVSSRATALGIDFLGVGIAEEGIELRNAGIQAPIIILAQELKERSEEIVLFNLIPTVCSRDFLESLEREGKRQNKKVPIFVMVDTGMGRYGVSADEFIYFIKLINNKEFIELKGVMSHFPVADSDKGFTQKQIDKFNELTKVSSSLGIEIPIKSMANSAAFLLYENSLFDMVRLGLLLYGISPVENINPSEYKPVMTVKSKISFIKTIPPGHSVSYSRTFTAKEPTTVATVPLGYADGYDRSLSNKGWMMVHGKKAPVIGNVTMDTTMIDITQIQDVNIGDEVIVMNKEINAWEIAKTIGTIPYEIVSRMGKRLPRLYV